MDYARVFQDLDICEKVREKEITEIWEWAGEDMGGDEYAMKIPGDTPYNNPNCELPAAYWFYRPKNIPDCETGKTLWVMGWNYERHTDVALESFAHRVDGTLSIRVADCTWDLETYEDIQNADDWNKFVISKIEGDRFGIPSACGGVHCPFNCRGEYDYDNLERYTSTCDDWYNYPYLTGQTNTIDCTAWNCDCNPDGTHPGCSEENYMKYWLSHLPKVDGTTNGKWNNWWKYIFDYDNEPETTTTTTSTLSITSTTTSTIRPTTTTTQSSGTTTTSTTFTTTSTTTTITSTTTRLPTSTTTTITLTTTTIQCNEFSTCSVCISHRCKWCENPSIGSSGCKTVCSWESCFQGTCLGINCPGVTTTSSTTTTVATTTTIGGLFTTLTASTTTTTITSTTSTRLISTTTVSTTTTFYVTTTEETTTTTKPKEKTSNKNIKTIAGIIGVLGIVGVVIILL